MIWIYLALAATFIALLLGFYMAFKDRKKVNSYTEDKFIWQFAFVLALIVAVVGGVIAAIANGISYQVIKGYEAKAHALPGQYSVVALADTTRTSGRTALTFGRIDEKPVYYYYGNNGKGGVSRYWTNANDTSIVQDTKPGEAYLLKYETSPKNPFWSLITPGGNNARYWEFHVPAGSVNEDITLDNQN